MKRFAGIFAPCLYLAVFPAICPADQIAQLTEITPIQDFVFYDNGTTQSLTATSEVGLLFYTGPFSGMDIPSTLVLTATSPVGDISGGTPDSHGDFSGSFRISDYASGSVLLSGSFDGSGVLSGSNDNQTATFTVSGNSWMQSDSVGFSPDVAESLTITLSDFGSIPGMTGYLSPGVDAVGMGVISGETVPAAADPPPTTAAADPPAPEPETYLMAGGALAGISIFLRRHRDRSRR